MALDPFTIAFAAKTGFDILSAYTTGESAKARAAMTAQLAEFNAHAMEQDAFEVIKLGMAKKARYEAKAQEVVSKQNVAYAMADVDTSFGTAKALKEESRLMGQLNAKDIEDAAHSQALGYKAKALEYRFGSEMNTSAVNQAANNLLTSSIIKAGVETGLNWKKLGGGSNPAESANNTTYDKLVEKINELSPQLESWSGNNSLSVPNMGPTLRY